MDKPPHVADKEKEKLGKRKATSEKLPALNLSPVTSAASDTAKEKQPVAGLEPQGSATALERIAPDDEQDVYKSKIVGSKELTGGEKETVIKGRGLILTEDKEGYEFMYDMLTGLRATCSKKDYRSVKISQADFEQFHDLRFPSKGSSMTPPHMQRDFKFADYAPIVFARIREAFGIDPADYLDSLAKEYNLSCVRSPGKSGSVFYYSADGRFMIKTITQSECHFLQSILPGYYNHVIQHPDTLLTRFLGLHRVKPHKDKKAYIVVMSNVLFSAYFDIDELYDLKGSTVGRAATQDANAPKKKGVVYKDLDFTRGFELGPAKAKMFHDTLRSDCKFLENQNIMDYSLLLGVHTLTPEDLKVDPLRPDMPPTPRASIRQRPTISYRSFFTHDWGGLRSTDAENNPTNTIYFIGVIDILQEYNVRKKLEHGFKSLKYESDKISAVNSSVYAQRFLNYMRSQIRTVPPKPKPPASPARAPAASLGALSPPPRPVSKLGVEIEGMPKSSPALLAPVPAPAPAPAPASAPATAPPAPTSSATSSSSSSPPLATTSPASPTDPARKEKKEKRERKEKRSATGGENAEQPILANGNGIKAAPVVVAEGKEKSNELKEPPAAKEKEPVVVVVSPKEPPKEMPKEKDEKDAGATAKKEKKRRAPKEETTAAATTTTASTQETAKATAEVKSV